MKSKQLTGTILAVLIFLGGSMCFAADYFVTRLESGNKVIPDDPTLDIVYQDGTGTTPLDVGLAASPTSVNSIRTEHLVYTSGKGIRGSATATGTPLRTRSITVPSTSADFFIRMTLQPLTAGGELLFDIGTGRTVTFQSSTIQNNTTASSFRKTGKGTLWLYGSSISVSGIVYLEEGKVLAGEANQTIGALDGGGSSSGIFRLNKILTTGGNNASTTYNGIIELAGGSLVKMGTGTFTLGGTNTYGGGTTVSNGTLLIKGPTGSIIGPVSVKSNATLAVTGGAKISGGGGVVVTNSGTLALGTDSAAGGASIDVVELKDGATIKWHVLNASSYSQLTNGTTLTLPTSGTVKVDIVALAGYTIHAADTFTLYSGATINNFSADRFTLTDSGSVWPFGWQIQESGGALLLTAMPPKGTVISIM